MCTLEKRNNLFILTLTGDDDHRLSPTVIASLSSYLSEIKSQATPGSVLITTAKGGKFFSNGFDLAWAQAAGSGTAAGDRLHQMVLSLKPVLAALLSLPMPTIAALPGHAAAAGLILAMSHDYILMRGDKGVLYMPEIDIRLPLPDYFAVMLRLKIGSATARRDLSLSGMKVNAADAVKMGIVDSAHDGAEGTVDAAMRLAEQLGKKKWDGEVYAAIRMNLYPELCDVLGLTYKVVLSKL